MLKSILLSILVSVIITLIFFAIGIPGFFGFLALPFIFTGFRSKQKDTLDSRENYPFG